MGNCDEDVDLEEVVDLTEYDKRQRWWNRVFGNHSGPVAVATQITIGGVSGGCAGYLFQAFGKVAAMAVGGGLLMLQVANNSGYIQVDWNRVEKDVNKAKKKQDTVFQKSTEFVRKNIAITGSFVGGFLLGMRLNHVK